MRPAQVSASELKSSHRISSAWKKFMTMKYELTTRKVSLYDCLKLFDSVVSATVLYGCEAWTLTKNLSQQIRCAQRRMLRMILGSQRRPIYTEDGVKNVESWVEWAQRTTKTVEQRMRSINVGDWVETCNTRKRKWAQQLLTSDVDTWAGRILLWQPDPDTHVRVPGRPRRRWTDDVKDLFDS